MHDKERLFIYGTLTDPGIQRSLFGGVVVGTADVLTGFALGSTKVNGVHYPNLIPEADGVVNGRVVELTQDELKIADDYETGAYERRRFVLRSGVNAWAYIRD
jgi:gamma-glutamylcyclotransferase (GGCT)/AIG2-like uncharacterized protein YtfP